MRGEAQIYIFDVKGGSEFVGLKNLSNVFIFTPDDPGPYRDAIQSLHTKAKAMAEFKEKKGFTGSFVDLWRKKVPGSTAKAYWPTLVVIDEWVEQIEPSKSDDDMTKETKAMLKGFIQKSLRRYGGSAFHVVLATQSARATDRALLDSATDSISFSVIGRQDVHMAASLKIPMLYHDREIQNHPGVFVYRHGAKTEKFYVG